MYVKNVVKLKIYCQLGIDHFMLKLQFLSTSAQGLKFVKKSLVCDVNSLRYSLLKLKIEMYVNVTSVNQISLYGPVGEFSKN